MIIIFLLKLFSGILLLLLATIVFDVLHILLHLSSRSRYYFLRTLGSLHATHHQFLDENLHINEPLMMRNVWRHVVPEFIVQVAVTLALAPLFPLPAVGLALFIELGVFLFIMWDKPGVDINHKPIDQLKAYRPLYFCVPEYHLLHHVFPDAHFSSWIKTLDHLLCTGIAIQDRHILLTSGNTKFGKTFAQELNNAGAEVTVIDKKNPAQDAAWSDALKQSDILVLCHQPDTSSRYQEIIELFYKTHRNRRIPVEVWALASCREFNDISQASDAQFAKEWFVAEKIIYRHLVANGFDSDARLVKSILKRIRRGFNYVPGFWNAAMLRHYWQFVLK